MIFLPSLFYTFLLTTLIKRTSQQTTFCDPSNRPATCGYDYTPVCTFPTGCNDYTCTSTQRNACTACKDTTVAYYINGACPQDSIGTSDTDGSDAGSDAGAGTGTGETDGSDGSDAGTETGETGSDDGSTTNSTTPDGTNSTNSTDIDTNSTTNSTTGSGGDSGSSNGNSTGSDPGTGTGNTTNSTNSTNNNSSSDPDAATTIPCADYGAMIRSSGKVILGALCCGSEPKKCPKASTKVCGVLTNCIGDICRKTYKNYCTACHDNTTSVQLYLNAPCETLFPI